MAWAALLRTMAVEAVRVWSRVGMAWSAFSWPRAMAAALLISGLGSVRAVISSGMAAVAPI
jgi:hypothetical protein